MIIISPYAKALTNGDDNPKNYPWWSELISMLPDVVVQVGRSGEKPLIDQCLWDLSLNDLTGLLNECVTWISCDSMFQHWAWHVGKPGVVIWGQSDPLIFGHDSNTNLLKGREYLFHNQFFSWDLIPPRSDCFVEPSVVLEAVLKHYK